jgi:hypothetical protein
VTWRTVRIVMALAGSRMDESTLPIYRNATETLMDCLTALKI